MNDILNQISQIDKDKKKLFVDLLKNFKKYNPLSRKILQQKKGLALSISLKIT